MSQKNAFEGYKWVRDLLYAFKRVRNDISVLKNPYIDTNIAFLTLLEAEIWKNNQSGAWKSQK